MKKIAIIGQGYVGLPLALAFAKHFPVIGFDINPYRINRLNQGIDDTKEIDQIPLQEAQETFRKSDATKGYFATSQKEDITQADIYIITVPTPVNEFNAPDLTPLQEASKMVGSMLTKGNIVIYESTVYPGCTEEECIPLLEKYSNLIFNEDFYVGYSPERINPGDKINTLESIVKVTSGSTEAIALEIDNLYKTIIKAGTHRASSIKVAEAAKVIENAQRDVNISFVNELALIFDRLDIDTNEVLEAAGTKFNFLKFKPGLVGGHCISVDPYYLAHKAIQVGYYPDVILSGRRVNDEIPIFIASKVVKLMIQKKIDVSTSRVLLLGFAFKENCPDTRNTKVAQIYKELVSYGVEVVVYDPWVDEKEVYVEYGMKVISDKKDLDNHSHYFDALILVTAHSDFKNFNTKKFLNTPSVIFDTKSIWTSIFVDSRL